MHRQFSIIAITILLQTGLFLPFSVAESSVIRFTNENWHVLSHPKVASFGQRADGTWTGTTEDGRLFYQYVVPNPYGINVERFEIDDHYHYIVEGEIADSFTEFSALLAQAYARTQA